MATAIPETRAFTASSELSRARRRARAASLVGSTVEWYDYFAFATASALVFGDVFFPSAQRLSGTMQSFAVLGVGFVARPIGGLVLGRLGDRYGRRRVLLTTLWTMGLASTAIGVLPTAGQVGSLAPVLLVVLRLVQGFGVGGEWAGAALVAVENAPADRKARWGSLPQMGTALGAVLATAVFVPVSTLSDAALQTWGWRVPFLASSVVLAIGVWIRAGILETVDFQALESTGAISPAPITESVRSDRVPLLLSVGMRLAENMWGYLVLVFALSYVPRAGHFDRDVALVAVSSSVLAGVGCYWGAALLADRVGRQRVFVVGAVFGIGFAWPFFQMLSSDSLVIVWVALFLGWGIASGVNFAIEPAWFTELFGRSTRYTGLSLAYNVATMLSGFTPFIATALLRWGGGARPIVALLVLLGLLSLGSALLAPDRYGAGRPPARRR
ncbi:MFS transporter [Flexivirga oryzae]|uniref:MFS family permease n=1 Tax=Flexivirga oryzae TaxID=1794944 RepID=A0A839N2X3_9MICO|nr:MFS family permease [Flexivirga oryzae]